MFNSSALNRFTLGGYPQLSQTHLGTAVITATVSASASAKKIAYITASANVNAVSVSVGDRLVPCTASISSVASVAGTSIKIRPLTAEITGAISAVAHCNVDYLSAAQISATCATNAVAARVKNISASITGSTTAHGDLLRSIPIVAQVNGVVGCASNMLRTAMIDANAAVLVEATATMFIDKPVAASVMTTGVMSAPFVLVNESTNSGAVGRLMIIPPENRNIMINERRIITIAATERVIHIKRAA